MKLLGAISSPSHFLALFMLTGCCKGLFYYNGVECLLRYYLFDELPNRQDYPTEQTTGSSLTHPSPLPELQHLPLRINHQLYSLSIKIHQQNQREPLDGAKSIEHKIQLLQEIEVLPEVLAAEERSIWKNLVPQR